MAEQSKCTVKWFNVKNHFGFFTLETGEDVFVHRKRLDIDNISLDSMSEEAKAEIVYEEEGGRLRATKVLWVGKDPTQKSRVVRRKQPKTDRLQVGDRVPVEIRRYYSTRGFGFAKPVGKVHPDLFFHVSQVPEGLQADLVPGNVFDAAVGENDQGLTAVIFQLHEETLAAE